MNTTPAEISAEALRFVRTEKSLSAAIAQHKEAERRVARWTEHAKSGDATAQKMLASHTESAEAWALRVAELFEAEQPEVLAAPEAPVEVEAKPAKLAPATDCRVRAMRAAFAASKSVGLDTKKADAMKVALAKYLGLRPGFSRRDLSAGQWLEAAAGIECRLITWA